MASTIIYKVPNGVERALLFCLGTAMTLAVFFLKLFSKHPKRDGSMSFETQDHHTSFEEIMAGNGSGNFEI